MPNKHFSLTTLTDKNMEAMLVLILISIVVAGGFLVVFIRMLMRGGYDDIVSPSILPLDEEVPLDEKK